MSFNTLPSVGHCITLLHCYFEGRLPTDWDTDPKWTMERINWLTEAEYVAIDEHDQPRCTEKGCCLVHAIMHLPRPEQIWRMPDGTQ